MVISYSAPSVHKLRYIWGKSGGDQFLMHPFLVQTLIEDKHLLIQTDTASITFPVDLLPCVCMIERQHLTSTLKTLSGRLT